MLEAEKASDPLSHAISQEIRVIEQCGQSADHPILADMPETRDLKCFIVQAFERKATSSPPSRWTSAHLQGCSSRFCKH